jgi:hypothetical protein
MSGTCTETTKRAGEYQVLLDGRFVLVSSLTKEQAHELLCDACDILCKLEEKLSAISARVSHASQMIEQWRNEGKP